MLRPIFHRAFGDSGAHPRGYVTVAHSQTAEPTRRDFIYVATGAVGAAAVVLAAVPVIDQMNPSADVLALASVEFDISAIQPGQVVTIMWRGKPVFIRRRTPEEIKEAEDFPVSELIDPYARNASLPDSAPATDNNRLAPDMPGSTDTSKAMTQWLIVVGVCTHLGCIPLAHRGNYGGWQCPCHGSQYDTAGRVRVGPAPQNLAVPVYAFLSDTKVRIG
jgi:ubiquinol-cytochrome c reductase iron-sulfur subunit